MSEEQELQDLLSESNSSADTATNRLTESSSPVASSERPVSVEFSQWNLGPNDTFRPTGCTTKTLPAGIYTIGADNLGVYFTKSVVQTDELYDLDDTASERVIRGIELFWKSRDAFVSRNILFKRGVLLWGPAGSGKTCTVASVCRSLVRQGGIVVLCSCPELTVGGLQALRRIEKTRPLIVVAEDIEEIIKNWGEHSLLALLDGEHQVDNVVHLATTNYPEQLGARIVNRPSRFDEVIKIGMPNDKARQRYLEQVMRNAMEATELHRWVHDTQGLGVAHLRELVVATQCLGRPYEETLSRLKHMGTRAKSDDETSPTGFRV